MDVWTEVLCEEAIVVHVDDFQIIAAIDEMTERKARSIVEHVEERRARQEAVRRYRRRAHELERELRTRRRAREKLREAGYRESEVPL
jgi:hypothetical protein